MTPEEVLKQVDRDAALLKQAHDELVKEAEKEAARKRKAIAELRNLEIRLQKIKAKSLTSNVDKSMETVLARLQEIRDKVAASKQQAEHLRTLSKSTTSRKKKPRVKRGVFDDL